MATKIQCPHCKGLVKCPACNLVKTRVTPKQVDAVMENLYADAETMKTELGEVHEVNKHTAAVIEMYRHFARCVYEINGFGAPEVIPDRLAALVKKYEITHEGYFEVPAENLEKMNLSIIHLERCFRCGKAVRLAIDLPASQPAKRKEGSRSWCGSTSCTIFKKEDTEDAVSAVENKDDPL